MKVWKGERQLDQWRGGDSWGSSMKGGYSERWGKKHDYVRSLKPERTENNRIFSSPSCVISQYLAIFSFKNLTNSILDMTDGCFLHQPPSHSLTLLHNGTHFPEFQVSFFPCFMILLHMYVMCFHAFKLYYYMNGIKLCIQPFLTSFFINITS